MSSAYIDKIASVPLFVSFKQPLRDHLADIVADISTARVLKQGEHLYTAGAIDDNTGAILVSGELTIIFTKNPPISVNAPELFGEMQQFNKYGTRTATVSAKDPTVVLEFAWHEFVARIKDRPDISQADHAVIRDAFTKFASERFKRL